MAQRKLAAIARSYIVKPFQHFFNFFSPADSANWTVRLRLVLKYADSFFTVNRRATKSGLMFVPAQSYGGSIYAICQQASRCSIVPLVFEICYLLHGHYS